MFISFAKGAWILHPYISLQKDSNVKIKFYFSFQFDDLLTAIQIHWKKKTKMERKA